jgi:hypothetical protein
MFTDDYLSSYVLELVFGSDAEVEMHSEKSINAIKVVSR